MSTLMFVAFLIVQTSSTHGSALIQPLPDIAFDSSSTYFGYQASDAKFEQNGWLSSDDTNNEWIRVDLGDEYVIHKISTKGMSVDKFKQMWTETYTLQYATINGLYTTHPTTFQGNNDGSTARNNTLSPNIIARYLRFNVDTWHTWPAMRIEAYGYVWVTNAPTTSEPTSTTISSTETPTISSTNRNSANAASSTLKTDSIVTEKTDNENVSIVVHNTGMGELLIWNLLLLGVIILCLLFCNFMLCKMYIKYNENKKDEVPKMKIQMNVRSDTNEISNTMEDMDGLDPIAHMNTIMNTNTDGLGIDTNKLNTIREITTPKPEGEKNDNELSVMDININIKSIKHGIFNDSVTVTEGNDSTTKGDNTVYMTGTFQSRNDTLENILGDVINKDIYENTHSNPNPISYQHSGQNSDQKSYVYNGSDEKSVTVNMSAHSYGTHTSGKKKNNIKLILYDFDQTITVIHLYKELNGSNVTEFEMHISNERLIEIFGGNDRIERLNKHFMFLLSKNIKLGILSFGYSKVIEMALCKVNMLQYFSFIIGRDSESLKPKFGKHLKKTIYISNLINTNKYNKGEILFVDDDTQNIETVKQMDCCLTKHIQPQVGMNENHLLQIECMFNEI